MKAENGGSSAKKAKVDLVEERSKGLGKRLADQFDEGDASDSPTEDEVVIEFFHLYQ